MKKRTLRIVFNAPITLTFVIICLVALLLDGLTHGLTTYQVFSTYGSSPFSIMTYVRLIGHVFGHSSFNHLLSNALYILLLGPILEEKYGSDLIWVIIVTAIVTGAAHNLFFPRSALLGASGVVFAFILLASFAGGGRGIPVTFILVAILWIGGEIVDMVTVADNVSQFTHILGGCSGALMGHLLAKR